jgi:hypothetical protein
VSSGIGVREPNTPWLGEARPLPELERIRRKIYAMRQEARSNIFDYLKVF